VELNTKICQHFSILWKLQSRMLFNSPGLKKYDVVNLFSQPPEAIFLTFQIRKGDTEAAWKQCAQIVSGT